MGNNISFWILACLIAALIIWRIISSLVPPGKVNSKYFYISIGILIMIGLGWYSMNMKELTNNSKFDPIKSIATASGFLSKEQILIYYADDVIPLLGKVKAVSQETFYAKDNMGIVEQGEKLDYWNIKINIQDKGLDNQIISIIDHDSKGTPINKNIYKFNKYGNLFLIEYLDQRDSLLIRTKYTYDENHVLNERFSYMGKDKSGEIYKIDKTIATGLSIVRNDTIYNILNYTYDSNGRIKKIESYSNINDYIISEVEYEYDDKQTKYKFVQYLDKEHQQIAEIEEKIYSNSGLLLERNSRGSQNGDYIQKFVRQFDKHGNWTKTIAYEKGTPTFIAYRKITYDE